jgi:uroporphyrinogen III methyltransferase/synthase
MDSALDQIEKYDWILFASVNAVDAFFDRLESFGRTEDELTRIKMAAIGPATADALAERGLTAAFKPAKFVAETLVAQFPGYPNLNGKRILWPRTNAGRSYIIEKFTEAGAQLDIVPAYTTSEPDDASAAGQRLVHLLKEKQLDVITLASAQSAANLAKMITQGIQSDGKGNASLQQMLAPVKIATIGPETSSAALRVLGRSNIEASQHTITGLVDAIVGHYGSQKH